MTNPKSTMSPEEQKVFDEYKKVAKQRAENHWLRDSLGKKVQIYCSRSPSVEGTLKAFDGRFGRILVENDHEVVEVALSAITQVRYEK